MRADVPKDFVLSSRRCAFSWSILPHPFAQRHLLSTSDSAIFHSPTAGALLDLTADHVVQGRVIFPGAGYLEMARAAVASTTALHGVFFLQPLAVEVAGLPVECRAAEGLFEVRSGEEGAMSEAAVYCSGALVADHHQGRQVVNHALVRVGSCARAADVSALYDGLAAVGLQYGPGYRTLVQAWSGAGDAAVARLCARSGQQGTQDRVMVGRNRRIGHDRQRGHSLDCSPPGKRPPAHLRGSNQGLNGGGTNET